MAAAFNLQFTLARDLQADRQTVGVGAANAPVAFDKPGVIGDALAVQRQVGSTGHAPDHFAHRGAGFDGRRQARLVQVGKHYAAAVEGLEHHFIRLRADLGQAPVAEKTHAGVQVLDAISDFINT